MTGRKVEIDLGGVWTDITSYVRYESAITITRGRTDEGRDVDRGSCAFVLSNGDGRFSPRNPLSPYYGTLGRNTPVRVSCTGGSRAMAAPTGAAVATTADKATLDITGDIDIRLEASMPSWYDTVDLAAKWIESGNQRSWFLGMSNGCIDLFWSTTGANLLGPMSSTMPVPRASGRQAIRVTLDANNGASGRTATFYTADTISGTWVQLGDPVVEAGTTSIFSSTATLTVGASIHGFGPGWTGECQAFQLRNGIGGTVVANPDYSIPAEGTTSFADTAGTPNTWTLTGGAVVTNRRFRFHGEISEWPVRGDISGSDVWVNVEASGIIRRLTQGARPLNSSLHRTILHDLDPVAYWPCEDAAGSTRVGTPVVGGTPMVITTGEVEFGQDGPVGGSGAIAPQGLAQLAAPVTGMATTSPAGWMVAWWISLPAEGAGYADATDYSHWVSWRTPGASLWVRWFCYVAAGNGGRFTIRAFNAAQDNQTLNSSPTTDIRGTTAFILLRGRTSGANTVVDLYVNGVLDDTLTAAGSTASHVTGVAINPINDGPVKGSLSQIVVDYESEYTAYLAAMGSAGEGFSGETAGERAERLCGEEGVVFQARGDLADTEAMGPQAPLTLLQLVQQCAEVDMGMLLEPREALGLGYRPRKTFYNQAAGLALTHSAHELAAPLDPVDDDQGVRNDITVNRSDGSSERRFLAEGALSILPPPDGVGRYDEGLTLNLSADGQLADQAGWRLHLGTVDEARYPRISLNLKHQAFATNDALTALALALDVGDRITVDGLPAWLPPDDVSQIVQGSTERLGGMTHEITFNCAPEAPYRVAVADDEVLGRADTAGSELAEDLTTTETGVDVATASGPIWTTDAGEMPFDVVCGGEVMTVTAISGASSPQTFTVTRSVNGVVKAHTTGADVRLLQPMITPL